MILEYIIFIQLLLRRVLLFLIQINYLHTNLSKNKVYVIVMQVPKRSAIKECPSPRDADVLDA